MKASHVQRPIHSAAVGNDLNDRYLWNSIKAVVDAFNGSVHFYE